MRDTQSPVILILGPGSLGTARRIKAALGAAQIHGLSGRIADPVDGIYPHLGDEIRRLFAANRPIVALCAAGIVIRALAPLLSNKRAEPPVLAVAEDGSAVVPLLGGLAGVNDLARRVGAALATKPAITTTGEIRFGLALDAPPPGWVPADLDAGKAFMSDLLAGATVRLSGSAPWIEKSALPFAETANHEILITLETVPPHPNRLVYHPKALAIALDPATGILDDPALARRILDEMAGLSLARPALALIAAPQSGAGDQRLYALGHTLDLPVRLLPDHAGADQAHSLAAAIVGENGTIYAASNGLAIAGTDRPIAVETVGRARGRLAVVGLGPGAASWRSPAVAAELARATDIIGYAPYVAMAEPLGAHQVRHLSDNRQELDRSRTALDLAATGRSVVLVSSGDPGIFAMAAAVLETLENALDPAWAGVELVIEPGITAAQAAAARVGAPLGHDCCLLSLSDVLKPWGVIEARLAAVAAADLVIALYNPISRHRPWQLAEAVAILRSYRGDDTPVILAKDVGRPDEAVRTVCLGDLAGDRAAAAVDSRTLVIVGSSRTRRFIDQGGTAWTYTPRFYHPAQTVQDHGP